MKSVAKMGKLVVASVLACFVSLAGVVGARAGKPLSAEAPFNDHCTSGVISVATGAWTAVPTTACAGRVGLYLTVVSTANANMGANFDNSVSTGIKPIMLKPGITQYHGASDAEPIYIKSDHTSTESIFYIEMKQ